MTRRFWLSVRNAKTFLNETLWKTYRTDGVKPLILCASVLACLSLQRVSLWKKCLLLRAFLSTKVDLTDKSAA
jgi:hypothetical protein